MTLEKLRQRLEQTRLFPYIERVPIENITVRETMEHEGIARAVRQPGFVPCAVGFAWGKPWSTAWFRFRFKVPRSFADYPVVARIQTGGEACCYLDGAPLQGLDRHHQEIRLLDRAVGGERFDLVVEAGAQGAFGEDQHPTLSLAEIASVHAEMRTYWWDLDALIELIDGLPATSRRRATVLRTLNHSIDLLLRDGFDPATARNRAKEARALLKPLFALPAAASELELSLIGHAHIDVAWLWPLRETVRKCSRTFSTVVKYMEEYPDYKFAQSQAHLYWFVQQHYPELFERIRKLVRQKRWEPAAGMWVEPDMNLTGAEALVRHILLAKRFTREHFGYETDVLWLPDVFGYSAALPQVLQKGGIRYFSTIKLFWNESNRPPYQSFWWEGIDGTRVLAHFPPNGDYNAMIYGQRLRDTAAQYQEKDRTDCALFPFGHGDGGGGPELRHLERARRYADLDGIPRTRMSFITDFFHRLEQQSADLPVWRGELYLETHRGTYTSQAANKRNNRKSELLFREAEFLASLAHWVGGDYPRERLNEGWRTILLNQFHDILPGSSIAEVYRESAEDYARVRAIGESVRDQALATLAAAVDTQVDGTPVLVVNSLPWRRDTTITLDVPPKQQGQVVGPEGPVTTVRRGAQLQFAVSLPPMGYAVYAIQPGTEPAPVSPSVKVGERSIESDLYRIRFDRQGLIASIFDKATRREVVASGRRANIFQRFQDRPTAFDAWNIDEDALDTGVDITALEHVEPVDLGPQRGGIRQTRRWGKSTIRQTIWLQAHCPMIHFDTEVDWNEDWQLLKVAFPLALHAEHVTCEIQFGHVQRPTHTNTSWDRARFEICAHKWVDVAEPGYGVALLNDCKFGHDVRGNVLRLTLLKSAKSPDPQADMGLHQFRYALVPHAGDFRQAEIIRRAYEFNLGATAQIVGHHAGRLPRAMGLLYVDVPNVMIEAVKVEEDGARWIVRCYEAFGTRTVATIACGAAVKAVSECDLLERNHRPLAVRDNAFTFPIAPFEIRTFAIRFA